jgi:hypothetical protein
MYTHINVIRIHLPAGALKVAGHNPNREVVGIERSSGLLIRVGLLQYKQVITMVRVKT